MHDLFNQKFQKREVTLHPGEFFSTSDDMIISTLLGSCISVILFDPVEKLAGMNHFMLPEKISGNYFLTRSGKYGMQAMELLINDLIKKGAQKSRIVAKVFGGGSVLSMNSKISIATSNINFALDYLEVEEIPVLAADLGGSYARKIKLLTHENRVLLKRIERSRAESISEIAKEEKAYQDSIIKEEKDWGDVISFK